MAPVPLILFALFIVNCEESLKPASAALEQNDPAAASRILESVRQECAQSSYFFELSAITKDLSGDPAGAEAAFTKAVSLNPKSVRLLTELGSVYLRNKKPEPAIRCLERASALEPSNLNVTKYLIGAYVESRNWSRASTLINAIDPEKYAELASEPIVTLWIAQTFVETNQTARLDAFLGRQPAPLTPPLLFSLGTLFAEHEMYQRAVEYFQRIKAENADEAVYYNLGLAHSHLHQFEMARQCYFHAIDHNPKHVDAYFHVGLDYASSGSLRKAIPWLYRALEWAPGRAEIAYALAEQLLQLKYVKTAQEVVNTGLKQNPGNPLLTTASGDIAQESGDSRTARDRYHEALRRDPKLVAALVGLSRLAESQLQDVEARGYLKQALSVAPQDPAITGQLGLIAARQNDWSAAVQYLHRSWAEDQSNVAFGLELARAYRHTNRNSEALELLISLKPFVGDSRPFHLEMAQVYAQLRRTVEAQAERETVARLEEESHETLRFENSQTYIY